MDSGFYHVKCGTHLMQTRPAVVRLVIFALTFSLTLAIRVRGISSHFWMLTDQIRDWSIALRPFSDLPLVGPPTHVGGYTIGPAFYWMLWGIRVTVGPWFDNLPHAGGIGQAMLQSAADTLLVAAVWYRTRSIWLALAAVVALATAAYDLCLAPLVWNPVAGSTLAKAATALVLLDWPRKSAIAVGVTAAIAWSAVHAYTGAIFVAVGVFAALLADPFMRGNRPTAIRNASIIAIVVAILQLPLLAHRLSDRGARAMGAVADSLLRVATGEALPEASKSVAGYAAAVNFIQGAPWQLPIAWVLLVCSALVVVRYRRDPVLLAIVLLPQILAIVGYALFLDDLDHYYYLSLMPAAVLTVLLGLTAFLSTRLVQIAGIALLVLGLAIAPARIRHAATLHRMPEYGPLVEGSRRIARTGQAVRDIETELSLPKTSNSEFVYEILGGRIDPASPWVATIKANGQVEYRKVEGS
jgi:hypothetical protein